MAAAAADAEGLRDLKWPDPRFDAFHAELDEGLEHILTPLSAVDDAIASASIVSALEWVSELEGAGEHIVAARHVYPSIDPVCLN